MYIIVGGEKMAVVIPKNTVKRIRASLKYISFVVFGAIMAGVLNPEDAVWIEYGIRVLEWILGLFSG